MESKWTNEIKRIFQTYRENKATGEKEVGQSDFHLV
jgi:hypothetical protein